MADVKMKHPDTGARQISVRDDEVSMYLSQGWLRVESSQPAKKAAKKAAAKTSATPPADAPSA